MVESWNAVNSSQPVVWKQHLGFDAAERFALYDSQPLMGDQHRVEGRLKRHRAPRVGEPFGLDKGTELQHGLAPGPEVSL